MIIIVLTICCLSYALALVCIFHVHWTESPLDIQYVCILLGTFFFLFLCMLGHMVYQSMLVPSVWVYIVLLVWLFVSRDGFGLWYEYSLVSIIWHWHSQIQTDRHYISIVRSMMHYSIEWSVTSRTASSRLASVRAACCAAETRAHRMRGSAVVSLQPLYRLSPRA